MLVVALWLYNSVFVFRKNTLKYWGVVVHHICNLLSNRSKNSLKICKKIWRENCKQVWQKILTNGKSEQRECESSVKVLLCSYKSKIISKEKRSFLKSTISCYSIHIPWVQEENYSLEVNSFKLYSHDTQ